MNEYLKYIFLLISIILSYNFYKNKKYDNIAMITMFILYVLMQKNEHYTEDVVQTLSSMYNNGELTATKLTLTGDLRVNGNATIDNTLNTKAIVSDNLTVNKKTLGNLNVDGDLIVNNKAYINKSLFLNNNLILKPRRSICLGNSCDSWISENLDQNSSTGNVIRFKRTNGVPTMLVSTTEPGGCGTVTTWGCHDYHKTDNLDRYNPYNTQTIDPTSQPSNESFDIDNKFNTN